MQSDRFNSGLSLVVYGDIVLSINTQYNTKYKKKNLNMGDAIGRYGRYRFWHILDVISQMKSLLQSNVTDSMTTMYEKPQESQY